MTARNAYAAIVLPSLFGLALTSGCAIYIGDDDPEPPPCPVPVPTPVPCDDVPTWDPVGLINPHTGQCEYFGGPGCNPECGPCPLDYAEPGAAWPSWGFCDSECSGLDELNCLATSGCRAAYIEEGEAYFMDCLATDQTGPIQGGGCEQLDARECSRHDDCSALYTKNGFATRNGNDSENGPALPPEPYMAFAGCLDEPATCMDDSECASGQRCDTETVCAPCNAPTGYGCPPVCYGYCVPDDSSCYGEVDCFAAPPECPADTVPAVANGCWTGECLPLDECAPPPPFACSNIADETQCDALPECQPIYIEVGCTCDPECVCTGIEFDHCETAVVLDDGTAA